MGGRLLERGSVLADLELVQRDTACGTGRVVLLRGEAGIGKTAVIERFVTGLSSRVSVLRGWCDPSTTPRPLGPLVDMLADIPREHASGLRMAVDTGDTEAIYARLVDMLCNETAWVCVVEDAHWADGATLDLLRFLARRIHSLRLMLVVTYRDEEIGDQHPLTVLLGDLATSTAVSRIALAPLSAAAVTDLAGGTGVNAEALHRLTGGNPFYVTEVLGVGNDALPPDSLPRSVSEAVRGRLARLSSDGRETAYATAICGPRVHLSLLRKICPAAGRALSQCLGTGVLVADGDMVGFRHELARRAALGQIPAYRRREFHLRALAVLAEPPVAPEDLSALTSHAHEAEDYNAVIRYGPAAAERASSLGANREAAELYRLTLHHADTIPDAQRVVWLERYAGSSHLSGLSDVAIGAYHDAAALRRTMGDRLGEAAALRSASYILWLLGRLTESIDVGHTSLGLLEGMGPCPELAWSVANMADLALAAYDPRCNEYAARAIAVGTEIGDDAVVARAHFLLAFLSLRSGHAGWDGMQQAWRSAIATPDGPVHGGPLGAALCWLAALHHELVRADTYIHETYALCATYDMDVYQLFATGSKALVALHRGDWANALACAEDVLTRPTPTAMHRILPLITASLTHARRGDQPVGALLDEALAAGESTDLYRLGIVWAARAEAAWLSGDDETARAEAQAGLATATEHADPWMVGPLRRWALLAGGTFEDALTVDTVTPYRLEMDGDWSAAAAEWTRLGCHYDAAVARLGGDLPAVAAALDTFRDLGARAAAVRAQHRLSQLRSRHLDARRKGTIADPHGLTQREREVLELVSAGHSDAEIATTLYISPKTANRHVGAILAKLGVNNRTQAAALAHHRTSANQR